MTMSLIRKLDNTKLFLNQRSLSDVVAKFPEEIELKQIVAIYIEEVGVLEIPRKKLMKNRLKWAGRVDRMERERLTKRADALRVEDRRSRKRPRLIWEE